MHSDERQDASSQHPNATLYNAVTSCFIQAINDRQQVMQAHIAPLCRPTSLNGNVSNKRSRHAVQLFTLYVVCQLCQNSCGLGEDELHLEQTAALPQCLHTSIHRALSCRCTTVQHMSRSNKPKFGNILAACFDMAAPSSGRTREVQN